MPSSDYMTCCQIIVHFLFGCFKFKLQDRLVTAITRYMMPHQATLVPQLHLDTKNKQSDTGKDGRKANDHTGKF